MQHVIAYVATAVVFFAIDFLWLSRIATTFYQSRMGDLLLEKPNLAAAGAFYLFYVGGIVYFAVAPALQSGNWTQALFSGALLGLIAYGTYDITNLATIKNWSSLVTIVDLAWGTVLTGASATAGFFITRAIAGA